MAQLPEDEAEQYNKVDDKKQNVQASKKNSFQCHHCNGYHEISDVFLWSGCEHQYGRRCVVFHIRQMLYAKELPLCLVNNCNKLLLENEAELVLPQESLMTFYQIHNEYAPNMIDPDDEKQNQNHIGYQSLINGGHNNTDNSDDDDNDGLNISPHLFGRIDTDPHDDSSDDEDITYNPGRNMQERQPLLNGVNGDKQIYGGYNNMDAKRIEMFDCVICNEQHRNDERFEWSKCKCLYGRQCAENMIIMSLFEREIPKCSQCKQALEIWEAQNLLPFEEMEVLKEIMTLKISMESYKKQSNENDKDKDNGDKQEEPSTVNNDNNGNAEKSNIDKNDNGELLNEQSGNNVNNGKDKNSPSPSPKINGIPNGNKNEEIKEEKKDDYVNDEEEDPLPPSILVLPDNNYQALIPMDSDFVDDKGMKLNAKKEKQLRDQNLFYCSRCKQVISYLDDANNGKFTALKCEHQTCKECARKHTRHEIEILQNIPTCPVCPETITDSDMITLFDKQQAQRLMDQLFQQNSLKIPPFQPVPTTINPPQSTAGVVNNTQSDDDRNFNNNDIPQNQPPEPHINLPIEDENVGKKGKGIEDEYGICFTDHCNKKGKLNINNVKEEQTRLDCHYCGAIWCIKCGVEFHLGQTCQQYQQDMDIGIDNINDDMAIIYALQQQQNMGLQYEAMMNANNNVYDADVDDQNEEQFQTMYHNQGWQTCPKCLSVVDKDGGCNHITCKCGAHFCWICQQIVDEHDLSKHYDGIGQCPLNEPQVDLQPV